MVLLTAIKNFRQIRRKKCTSNALSIVDLSCMPVIEHCSPSTQTSLDKDMEIERYHAAFPALGTEVSASYLHHFDLSTVSNGNLETCAATRFNGMADDSCSPRTKHRNNHHRLGKYQQSKDKSSLSYSTNDNPYNHGQNKRTSKHMSVKPKKIMRAQPIEKRSSVNAKKSVPDQKNAELKPWKQLESVDDDLCTPLGKVDNYSDGTDGNTPWISNDLLDSVLNDDCRAESSDNVLHSLWVKSDETEQTVPALWTFDSAIADSLRLTGGGDGPANTKGPQATRIDNCEDDKEQGVSDYSMIEQSMATLKFCDDLPDACRDSRLMPLFRENPFSYMILDSRAVAKEDGNEDTMPILPGFSCRHCQESYEVVLDVESAGNRRTFDGILRDVDSRLNFDWCRYYPPPSDKDDQCKMDNEISSNSRYSCACEFCRSRAWTRTCAICGTPL